MAKLNRSIIVDEFEIPLEGIRSPFDSILSDFKSIQNALPRGSTPTKAIVNDIKNLQKQIEQVKKGLNSGDTPQLSIWLNRELQELSSATKPEVTQQVLDRLAKPIEKVAQLQQEAQSSQVMVDHLQSLEQLIQNDMTQETNRESITLILDKMEAVIKGASSLNTIVSKPSFFNRLFRTPSSENAPPLYPELQQLKSTLQIAMKISQQGSMQFRQFKAGVDLIELDQARDIRANGIKIGKKAIEQFKVALASKLGSLPSPSGEVIYATLSNGKNGFEEKPLKSPASSSRREKDQKNENLHYASLMWLKGPEQPPPLPPRPSRR